MRRLVAREAGGDPVAIKTPKIVRCGTVSVYVLFNVPKGFTWEELKE